MYRRLSSLRVPGTFPPSRRAKAPLGRDGGQSPMFRQPETRAPGENPAFINVGVRGCEADDGAVVLELAREGKLLAGLPGRASPLAVVEHDRGEAFTAKPLRERSESAGLDRGDA